MKEIFNESRRMSFTYYKLFLKHISSLYKEYILLKFIINQRQSQIYLSPSPIIKSLNFYFSRNFHSCPNKPPKIFNPHQGKGHHNQSRTKNLTNPPLCSQEIDFQIVQVISHQGMQQRWYKLFEGSSSRGKNRDTINWEKHSCFVQPGLLIVRNHFLPRNSFPSSKLSPHGQERWRF